MQNDVADLAPNSFHDFHDGSTTEMVPVFPDNAADIAPQSLSDAATDEMVPEFPDIVADVAPQSRSVAVTADAVSQFPLDTAFVELVYELPGPSSVGNNTVSGSLVPSPFKKHFFFKSTEVNKETKMKSKEKLPAIAFGEAIKNYQRLKIEKKENLAKLKLERANERQRKKAERVAQIDQRKAERRRKSEETKTAKAKKIRKKLSFSSASSESSAKITSGESDMEEEENEEEDEGDRNGTPPQKVDGEFVIVKYDAKFYPGVIVKAFPATASISAMTPVGRLWKWPERPDVLDYAWEAVVTHIKEPQKTSKTRNLFNVPEMIDFL